MHIYRKILVLALAAGLTAACSKSEDGVTADAAADATDLPSDLQSDAQKFGYAIGVDIGKSLTPVKDDVDVDALVKGLEETIAGKEPRMSDETREKVKAEISGKLQKKQMDDRLAKASVAKEAGVKFLADNGKREGVTTTASGLQYEVLTEGSGANPKKENKVTVHYKGTLIDGTEFDSSIARGEPVTFPLGNVIPGWTEGLQLMKAGGKAKLYIPSELGYGERGAGAKIGPNETLVFEVELIKIEKNEPVKTPKK